MLKHISLYMNNRYKQMNGEHFDLQKTMALKTVCLGVGSLFSGMVRSFAIKFILLGVC